MSKFFNLFDPISADGEPFNVPPLLLLPFLAASLLEGGLVLMLVCVGGGGNANPSKKSEWSKSKVGRGRAVGAGELSNVDPA